MLCTIISDGDETYVFGLGSRGRLSRNNSGVWAQSSRARARDWVYAAPQPQPIIQCAVVSVFVYSCLKIPEKMLSLTLHEINRCSTCSTIVEVPTIFTLAEERASKWGRHRPNPGTSKSFKSSHLFSHFPVQCRLFSDLPHTKMVHAAETGGKATADPLQTVTNYRKLVRHILTVSE